MKEADRITFELIGDLQQKHHLFVLPKYYINRYECDVYSITQSGYSCEYEIKISLEDFKKDFDKSNKNSWGVRTNNSPEIMKHSLIKTGKRTNRFYFVTPVGLIDKSELPEYAGWIVYGKLRYGFEQIIKLKEAPLLHKNKMDIKHTVPRSIADKVYWRYVYQQNEITRLHRRLND